MSDVDYTRAAADARYAALGGDESVIPEGSYCYTILGFEPAEGGRPPRMKTKLCPYWGADETAPDQAYGYCAKLKSGDWEEGGPSLLWDQCKECGVNMRDEQEEDAAQEEFLRMRTDASNSAQDAPPGSSLS